VLQNVTRVHFLLNVTGNLKLVGHNVQPDIDPKYESVVTTTQPQHTAIKRVVSILSNIVSTEWEEDCKN
jgi:hypothetical protein